MGVCHDKTTRMLRTQNYNVVRHPRDGINPLDLIGAFKDTVHQLGGLDKLITNPPPNPPTIARNQAAADLEGQQSDKQATGIGLSFLGSILKALGGDLDVSARPEVVCQRCMQPMRWPVKVKSRIALVSDYDAADRVPEGLEVFLVEGDSVSVRDLVDEEIMLALPNVPRHEEGSECAERRMQLPGHEVGPDEPDDSQVQKPFAQLGELLKRK